MRRLAVLPLAHLSAAVGVLALGLVAAAPAGAWDDSHMRSNFAHQRGPAPPRPPVQGLSRYEQATEDPAPTPPTDVAETTLQINPHGWEPGGPTGARTASPPWASKRHGFGSARPSASSGVRLTPSVRTNSVGTQRSNR